MISRVEKTTPDSHVRIAPPNSSRINLPWLCFKPQQSKSLDASLRSRLAELAHLLACVELLLDFVTIKCS